MRFKKKTDENQCRELHTPRFLTYQTNHIRRQDFGPIDIHLPIAPIIALLIFACIQSSATVGTNQNETLTMEGHMKFNDRHIELPLFTMNEVENNTQHVSIPQRNTTIVIDYSLKSSINLTDSRLSEIIREYRNKKAQSRKIARENHPRPKRSPSVKFKKKAGENQHIEIADTEENPQPSTSSRMMEEVMEGLLKKLSRKLSVRTTTAKN